METKRKVVYLKTLDKAQMDHEKAELINPLKKLIKNKLDVNRGIKLPQHIKFNLSNKCLYLYIQEQIDNYGQHLNAICDNMQTDNAAFEGWAIVLKTWLSGNIERVVLKWDKPTDMSTDKQCHYNRFLYRCVRFREFYSWFGIDSSNEIELSDFNERYTNLTINYSSKISDKKGNEENAIEYEFVETENQTNRVQFIKQFDLKILDHALPVGVKSCSKSFFTGRQSAIDIWGIDNNDYLNIFELKIAKNIKIGIISELFFYACVMRDLRTKTIETCNATIDTQKYLYKNITSLKGIKAFMLAGNFHPLVDNNDILETLNTSYQLTGIRYYMAKYHYDKGMYNLKFVVS